MDPVALLYVEKTSQAAWSIACDLLLCVAAGSVNPRPEIIDQPVADAGMEALDHLHVVKRNMQTRLLNLLEPAAVKTGHAVGF